MSGAVAGPSSTSTPSSPVRTRHCAAHAVEPYDSPLREGDSSFASYASGGLDAATDPQTSPSHRGHGDLGDIQTVIYSKRDSKGKGKAKETEYAHVADDVRIPVQFDTGTETVADPDADDEEAEERRIQEVRKSHQLRQTRANTDSGRRTSPSGPKPTPNDERLYVDLPVSVPAPSSLPHRSQARPT